MAELRSITCGDAVRRPKRHCQYAPFHEAVLWIRTSVCEICVVAGGGDSSPSRVLCDAFIYLHETVTVRRLT